MTMTTVSFYLHTEEDSETRAIITDENLVWFETPLYLLICVFSIVGAATNAVNIRVFIQQGLSSDSSTICLFALAISDFLGCFFMIPWTSCDFVKFAATKAEYQSCLYMSVILFAVPVSIIGKITCLITAYIAVERCLCVMAPFKVKTLLRPRVAAIAMALIYLMMVMLVTPLYTNIRVAWKFQSRFNASILALIENDFAKAYTPQLNLITHTIVAPTAIVIVALATGLMLHKLRKYRSWRKKSASAGGKHSVKAEDTGQGEKDIQLLKLVLMITGMFLICSSISLLPGITAAFVPGFSFTGFNINLFRLFNRFQILFDRINSSLNHFFYIRMSSRYKAAFNEVFRKKVV